MIEAPAPAPSMIKLRVCNDASAAPAAKWMISIGRSNTVPGAISSTKPSEKKRSVQRVERLAFGRVELFGRASGEVRAFADRLRGRAEPQTGHGRELRQSQHEPAVDKNDPQTGSGKRQGLDPAFRVRTER